MRLTDATQAVARLRELGQSVWIDDLTREMIAGGEVARLRERGVTGITANPTTFDKAVTGSDVYDGDIRRLAGRREPARILWDMLVDDVRRAAGVMLPVYETSAGADGYVSIEVAPDLAYDTEGTIRMARELWERCGRPNVMIKIPATEPGLPAIRQALAEGINVNVTLTFSVRRYREVVDAFLSGLEARRARGLPIHGVASVASFFVSRVDTKVDALLRERLEAVPAGEREPARALLGTVAIANSKLAYHWFQRLHAGSRWESLAARGARPQRCLWASTSVKDPSYPPTMYVEALAGPDTVDTMPPETFEGLAGADIAGPALTRDLELAQQRMERLAGLGVDLDDVTAQLETEGVRSFADSYRHLVGAIREKVDAMAPSRVEQAGEDSFPASDAPGWGGHTIGGPPPRQG